jgi:uncharacterized protein (DUF885 family)
VGVTRRELAIGFPAAAAVAGAVTPALAADSVTAFRVLADGEWRWREAQFGEDEDNRRVIPAFLPDVSLEAQAGRLARWRQVQADLAKFNPARFPPDERINFEVYRDQINALATAQAFGEWQAPFNSDTSFWGEAASASGRTFHTETDYRNYIAQLSQMRRYFDQQIAAMKLGLARGFTPPKATLVGRELSVSAVSEATPRGTTFWKPFEKFPARFSQSLCAELSAKGEAVIREQVIPAHKALFVFLSETYIPGARVSLGAYDLPDGKAYYQSKIKEFTTLDMSPGEIHALGLAEIGKIREEMQGVITEVKFSGDLPAFLKFLRSEPRFYVSTPQALLDRAAWIAKTFDGKAADWFGRLPRRRFAIVPVPASIAPFYTAGRGGPGVYLVNTYDLPSRPLYSLTALTLHESAPGHAFQMPLAAEQTDQPAFRRKSYISAFGEGWALYC